MSGTIDRRDFLKLMGWGSVGSVALSGCDLPTTVTLEEGKEEVVSYLMPEEYVIPGVGVWFASTCTQCAGGCGVHGRVREGRLLKLEGNPDSPVNHGKLCMMGQAGLQSHYNPDRLKTPMLRQAGKLEETTWEKAIAAIVEKSGTVNPEKVAWVTGAISGHQAVLVDSHLAALGASRHYVQEVLNNSVWQAVAKDMLGDANPRLHIAQAKVIVSFGADFLGTWGASPVHFAGEYAKFRGQASRGILVSIEPKMSLTGANSDLWMACEPGTEAIIALGLANNLIHLQQQDASMLSDAAKALIAKYDAATVTQQTGVSSDKLSKIAALLKQRSPSLVLAGASVQGQPEAYHAVAAIMLLNRLLGNIGHTIEAGGQFPFPQLLPKAGSSAALAAFAEDAAAAKLDLVFIHGTNPVYTAPIALGLDKAMQAIGFKVVLSQFMDETAAIADVLLPMASTVEDWGTHVATHASENAISMQQPLMTALYPTTKGFGDTVLALLKTIKANDWGKFADYYAYLRYAFAAMPADYKMVGSTDEQAWQSALQSGIIKLGAVRSPLSNAALGTNASAKDIDISVPVLDSASAEFPLHLAPSGRLGLWDGRHANLPWLQEAPDQISKVVWGSWAEIHPETAAKFGIKHGDMIKVSSEHGDLTVQAVLIKSIHKDVVAVPLGQGHEVYGRYASGRGVNPLRLLTATKDNKTKELALYATRVRVSNTGQHEVVVRLGSSDTQMGRPLVRTISADQLGRTEGA